MKRAFWYEEEETELDEVLPDPEEEDEDEEWEDWPDLNLILGDYCGDTGEAAGWRNVSVTENGAVGYRTSGHALLDMNFMVSFLRECGQQYVEEKFVKAYDESPEYAVRWLFFLRDIEQGLGERRVFRICMRYLAESHPDLAAAVMKLIPEYGRFDDLLLFLDTDLEERVCAWMKSLLEEDLLAIKENCPVSLLAKWLPGINTSSAESRRKAQILCRRFGMSHREYRRMLSGLRAYGNVLEVKLSASRWSDVAYETVPAKANLKYEAAFERHDRERRAAYLRSVLEGNAKLNSRGIMPHEVVHRYLKGTFGSCALKKDLLTELMWEQLLRQGFENDWGLEDCIVVADGSGSMYSHTVKRSSVMPIEICDGLAIYFAGLLKGAFHNKAITFSGSPRFIDLNAGKNLKEKLEIMMAYNEVANTNIEAVFDLLLNLAMRENVPAGELPSQVLIISDMEFDQASAPWGFGSGGTVWSPYTPLLFQQIEQRYRKAGYRMPRLIFWNVCGRTNTVPKMENERGLCLISGFSQNAAKIAADREETDPYESLLRVLDGPRYRKVAEAMAGVTRQSAQESAE